MKIIMAFLLMGLFLFCGCGHQAESRSRIVGTWMSSDANGTITYYPDGRFLSDWHYNISHTNIYNGTWQMAGDILTLTLTNASGSEPHERVGNVDHYRISHLNHSDLVVSDLLRTNVPIAFIREK